VRRFIYCSGKTRWCLQPCLLRQGTLSSGGGSVLIIGLAVVAAATRGFPPLLLAMGYHSCDALLHQYSTVNHILLRDGSLVGRTLHDDVVQYYGRGVRWRYVRATRILVNNLQRRYVMRS
jgi:hypothetical protein